MAAGAVVAEAGAVVGVDLAMEGGPMGAVVDDCCWNSNLPWSGGSPPLRLLRGVVVDPSASA